jgi:hypothetical protein
MFQGDRIFSSLVWHIVFYFICVCSKAAIKPMEFIYSIKKVMKLSDETCSFLHIGGLVFNLRSLCVTSITVKLWHI